MRTLVAVTLLTAIASYYYTQWNKPKGIAEIITSPNIRDAVHFRPGDFDRWRFPLNALDYVSQAGADDDEEEVLSIPITGWDELVNMGAKTELGRYWLDQFDVDRVMLMKEQIHEYPVTFRANESVLDRVMDVPSVKGFVDSRIREDAWVPEYKGVDLTHEDFVLGAEYAPPGEQHFRYFKEGVLLNTTGLAHYEVRFYEEKLLPVDRIAGLHRIVRAWARFTTKSGITAWLAHGSLLGYYFNGLIFPWDDDLDVQVTGKSFMKLVGLNRTIVVDYTDEIGMYLIDVNPWYGSRERESDNKIDARFIDLESGLYIDITTLASVSPDMAMLDHEEMDEFHKVFDPYHDEVKTLLLEHEHDFQEAVDTTVEQGELVSCKDYHFYTVAELSPVIPTLFEGVVVMVPNNIEAMLLREYSRKSLYLHTYKGFTFDKFKRTWAHPRIVSEYNGGMARFIGDHYSRVLQTTFKRHAFDATVLREYAVFRTGS